MNAAYEPDPQETAEWLDAMRAVVAVEGPDRARALLEALVDEAQRGGAHVSLGLDTPYLNTIARDRQPPMPGDPELEARLRHYVRWNAMATVVRANKDSSELGGHGATFASAATLYDVGFNHFFRAPSETFGGDMVFFQGHSSPGIYARAFLEGRITEKQLEGFRQETGGGGLPSYPHPWLMPDFWQFPTVSMGLGPLMSIYQAHFMRYVHDRGLRDTADRKVWAFVGDGETDEPETLGAISLAGREKLDNLIWVINCNLQRLDGPVRGNGKIIQELERVFKGAGWNVIKVIWGSGWDALLARDTTGRLAQLMNETVDGDYQTYKSRNGKYVRDEFFGRYPETAALVEDWTDDEIWALQRGGHDPVKVYAAYHAAFHHTGQPTVILAKTIKGYGMGEAGEALNIAHQAKHMDVEEMRAFRDRFYVPIPDDQIASIPFYRPPDDSPEMKYLKERVKAQGSLPQRRRTSESLAVPELAAFDAQLKGTGEREISTTMAFVRILNTIARDATVGPRIVPIVADESRTFGMEGMFRQLGIYSSVGQLYHPQDAEQLMWYREDKHGQILQEGINEAGALSSFISAGTSYSNHDLPMIPFYIFYSMFGFQRVGDLAWAAGDSRTRGFLLGGTSGRTTLNGEGLQHEDGHSQVFASFIPNCRSYDPTYGYEVAVIIQDGLRRMLTEQEDTYYYITLLNENYVHPDMPEGAAAGILRGMYLLRSSTTAGAAKKQPTVQLLGSGAILREVIAASELLASDWNVQSDIWSVTSFNEIARDGVATHRDNLMHPGAKAKLSYAETMLADRSGPAIAATDYVRLY
ncbi:MAG TPA: pyruvate dehydrogenase (acetyl-transferring), homodimeric type, partial [Candidatus Baltobacteraceae bacterium]|nr:pyruvate dehydrogenase (acetyl-transferring), homodimeric type [Candidatus Baltobacteraceae bacterium]